MLNLQKRPTMKSYFVKYWETEDDREQGNSHTYLITEDKETAIREAEKLFYRNNFSCVEVENISGTYLTLES